MEEGRGITYTNGGGGGIVIEKRVREGWKGRGIKNYNYNRYRALYPHLTTSLMQSETSPTPSTLFTFVGWG